MLTRWILTVLPCSREEASVAFKTQRLQTHHRGSCEVQGFRDGAFVIGNKHKEKQPQPRKQFKNNIAPVLQNNGEKKVFTLVGGGGAGSKGPWI